MKCIGRCDTRAQTRVSSQLRNLGATTSRRDGKAVMGGYTTRQRSKSDLDLRQCSVVCRHTKCNSQYTSVQTSDAKVWIVMQVIAACLSGPLSTRQRRDQPHHLNAPKEHHHSGLNMRGSDQTVKQTHCFTPLDSSPCPVSPTIAYTPSSRQPTRGRAAMKEKEQKHPIMECSWSYKNSLPSNKTKQERS